MTVTVRIAHVRAADLCTKGARNWFARNNLSWQDFLANGISSDILEKLGDPLGLKAVTVARKESEHG